MASEESFVVLVHHRGSIKRKTRSGVKFTDKNPLSIFMRPTMSCDDLVNSILQKLGLEGVKQVKKFFYRIQILVLQEIMKYDCFTIGSVEDLHVIFHCRRQFPKVKTPELLAKLVDVVSSSGGSNRNTPTVGTVADSSSKPTGASSSVPVYEPPVQPVASPSFTFDPNDSGGGEVGIGDFVPTSLQSAAPTENPIVNALLDDPDDNDVEPDIIVDDSGDDIGASEPAGAGDLDAMRQEGVPGEPAGFGARDGEVSAGLTEFQVGQQFQDKDEVVLSVKTYSIRRGIQYKVVESDYRRYVGKCFEFGNGCTWLIRLSVRQHKGIWEVKRYNGPHTCLATSISSDHMSLDYHVISAFIMPMVIADASINIKVLLRTGGSGWRSRRPLPTSMSLGQALFELGDRWTSRKLIFTDCSGHFHHVSRPSVIASRWSVLTAPICMASMGERCSSRLHKTGTPTFYLFYLHCLVEGENTESWSFFLSHLPTYHAFYIRHEAANFALTFKGKDARRLLVNAAYAKTEVEFNYWFDILRSEDPAMCEWANRIDGQESPCVLAGEATYGRLAELFICKGREAEAQLRSRQQFSQHLVKCIDANMKTARCFTVTLYDRDNSEFTISEMTPTDLFSLGNYRVYRLSSVFSVYRMGFTPPIPEGFWPSYDGMTVIPDPNKRRASKGRPKSTRIQTTMDEADPNRLKRCGFCRQSGHTRQGCPQVRGPSHTGGT
ncbi:uncharacterized protein LOC107469542 [Arachis duranensis]|uniref:Uncharacterized protein LOC107469542 n=1 Tax=Arachis duranensis TaxID=130453 RepID=A0A6P4C993_ARADU|nr:uncharacterized protein LOC107469542 [Arachis duranensis]